MTTNIEWVRNPDGTQGHTWAVTRGCSRVSPGCGGAAGVGGCYAEKIAGRFCEPTTRYPKPVFAGYARRGPNGARWTGLVAPLTQNLKMPFSWKRPGTVFCNSMSDLFHEDIPNDFIAAVFGVMQANPHLDFKLLTKRSARLPAWFRWVQTQEWDDGSCESPQTVCGLAAYGHGVTRAHDFLSWPLPNVHLGVSVESQDYIGRIGDLLKVPNAVPWVSAEPLLGALELAIYLPHLKWVVTGAESGHGARPMNEDWVRSLRDQCAAADVPFFYKQNVVGGRKSSLPILDGVQHMEMP